MHLHFELFPEHGSIFVLPSVGVFIFSFLLLADEKNEFTPRQRFSLLRTAAILSFVVKSEAAFYLPDCLVYIVFFCGRYTAGRSIRGLWKQSKSEKGALACPRAEAGDHDTYEGTA